jgi:hypothetical protein
MSLLFADDEDGGANEAHSWAKKVLKVFMPVSLSIFSLVSLRIFESIQVHTAVKMETFVVGVAPPLPRLNITATTEDLHKSPQLYFAVRSAIHSLHGRMIAEKLANKVAYRAPTSCGCLSRPD